MSLTTRPWEILNPEEIPWAALVKACAWTTVPIRLLCFVFLRWIPGPPLPKIATALFAINLPAFIALCLSLPHYDTKSDTSVIVATDPSTGGANGNEQAKDTSKIVVDATRVKVMERSKAPRWKTLTLGIPNLRDSPVLTIATLLLNICLMYWVYDLTWTSTLFYKSHELSFARVGWVSETSARILIREPKTSVFVTENPVYVVSYRLDEAAEDPGVIEFPLRHWTTLQVAQFDVQRDFTSPVELTGLQPNMRYKYLTTGNHTGTFVTAPKEKDGKFSFVTSSCIKQRFPYNPFEGHPLDIPGLKTLGGLLPTLKASFMVFLGDFIYIDVPRRPGTDKESYRMMYRQVYSSPDWEIAGSSLPWIHVLDDHEIANDWSEGETGLFQSAIDPFTSYHHSVNPPPVRTNATYYTFNWASASFFMLDTRRYRSPSHMEDGPSKTMLGEEQFTELRSWLHRIDKDIRWKIVISSVPFTKNWQHNSDTWRAYLWERSKILEDMWAVKDASVVVLSGDRHEFAATKFVPPEGHQHAGAAVHEFSVSPLSQFYLPIRTYKQTDSEDVMIKCENSLSKCQKRRRRINERNMAFVDADSRFARVHNRYMPDGNQKFGHIEIDSSNPAQSTLKYRLFINGVEQWEWTLLSIS